MKASKFLCILFLCISLQFIKAQNLLDTSTWTIGSGTVIGFSQNGTTAENIRELGLNHVGENVILWKAVPDVSSNADGGWNSDYITIDNTKKYRLSVWIKKTNSNDGISYFGCYSNNNGNQVYRLDGTNNPNPYFWYGDLPKLDRWYLLIGFLHEHNTSAITSEGAIYDGVTGEFVSNTHRDFKFSSTANNLAHRSYLYYDTNTSDRQYFYEPRIELVDGNELSLNELLSLHPNSGLQFAYDNSGNQKQRFYCPDNANCSVPTPPAGKITKEENTSVEEVDIQTDVADNLEDYSGQLIMYPNPTKELVNIKIKTELLSKIEFIKIYNINSSLVKSLKINHDQNLKVDLKDMPTGVYFVHIHLNDGSHSITRKIIKE
ncbi:T9SS type A sorting domain-containing protein [Flavivirga aquimarina]|uniref:T9SS type A sorting domain-containing protein n=1 Tax=Flavivirga aquimarina TaxID=2027862 RepID=A0ABT8W514_9FLAO|nr:T9SS type A sorting domain-containing protein [Flavivirga aquimarina]MDO5968193.1 T9SS type A sorting domain-containing protein [Flavivirga aquimarina]